MNTELGVERRTLHADVVTRLGDRRGDSLVDHDPQAHALGPEDANLGSDGQSGRNVQAGEPTSFPSQPAFETPVAVLVGVDLDEELTHLRQARVARGLVLEHPVGQLELRTDHVVEPRVLETRILGHVNLRAEH